MDRRAFVKGATLSAVALRMGLMARHTVRASTFAHLEVPALATQLLNVVNSERAAAGVDSLRLDERACRIAEAHAIEMAQNGFLSHWGLDGRKPYHRYSFDGGTEAIQENGGSMEYGVSIPPEELASSLMVMHKWMHDEVPPNDGHRKTILAPWHTHVGFGFANREFRVRLCEIYVARYVAIDPYPARGAPLSRFMFGGQLLEPAYSLEGIEVYYEPLPSPPDLKWLRTVRSYGLPDDREILMPKVRRGYEYEDGSKGSIELKGRGKFQVPILLSRKEPGIYTIVVWIQRPSGDTPFPATQVCVRAE